MARVILENLCKAFSGARGEEIRALNNASLSVADKEFVVLVGPSGCGKSTLLRLIAGLEEITSGVIRIDDQVVNDLEPKDRDLAMVFQNYALYPHMTVFENLAFGLKLRKFPRTEIDQRVRDVADLLGLTAQLERLPKALSGGQRQRVALGRAIVRRPKVFLFDEPLSNLDAQMRVQMRAEIARLHTHLGATMLYVTHDQVEAMTMGDRIVVMKDGVIQQVADPLTLYQRPVNQFVAGFIGTPPMNFFQGSLARQNGELFFHEQNPAGGGFRVRLPGGNSGRFGQWTGPGLTLGLRPEHLTIRAGNSPAEQTVVAKVEVVEHLGAETCLHFSTGAHRFVARVPGGLAMSVNESVPLVFDLGQAHFFDPTTEKVIC